MKQLTYPGFYLRLIKMYRWLERRQQARIDRLLQRLEKSRGLLESIELTMLEVKADYRIAKRDELEAELDKADTRYSDAISHASQLRRQAISLEAKAKEEYNAEATALQARITAIYHEDV